MEKKNDTPHQEKFLQVFRPKFREAKLGVTKESTTEHLEQIFNACIAEVWKDESLNTLIPEDKREPYAEGVKKVAIKELKEVTKNPQQYKNKYKASLLNKNYILELKDKHNKPGLNEKPTQEQTALDALKSIKNSIKQGASAAKNKAKDGVEKAKNKANTAATKVKNKFSGTSR